MCSNEFKKPDASFNTKCCQQSKNIRLNACVLKKLFDITGKNLCVDYFDFIGRRGILTRLFYHKSHYIGFALSQFVIVKNLVELEILQESIVNLYKWGKAVKSNSHIISTTIAYQVNKFTLADIYDVTTTFTSSTSTPTTPTPTPMPSICLTPPRPTIPAKRKSE